MTADREAPQSLFPNSRDWSVNLPGACLQKVSVIMRTKDRPLLLQRALQSVISQTYQNWHLHIVNDGGAPGEVDHCIRLLSCRFASKITVTHNKTNVGMEAASNIAISQSDAVFIAFLDDDDTWHPDFLMETALFLEGQENSRYAAVTTRSTLIRERIEGGVVIEEKREDWPWSPMIDMSQLLSRNSVLNNSLLIRKVAVDEIGAYNEDMPVLGDWDYVLRLLAIGDIGTIDKRLSNYHQRFTDHAQYGNTVTAGLDKHKRYDVLYRNSLVRHALSEPSTLGVLHVMLRMMEEHTNNLTRRMVEHDTIILNKIEENRKSVLEKMVEHDSFIVKTLNERFDRLDYCNENLLSQRRSTF